MHMGAKAELTLWMEALAEMASPLTELIASRNVAAIELLDAHIAFAEKLAASSDRPGLNGYGVAMRVKAQRP